MASLNRVLIIGNLGSDPEVRYMPNGESVCQISVATSESWKDKATGEKREKTEWHRVVMYRRLAEIAGEYLTKGKAVYLEGKLQTRKWQDQSGADRYTTEIVADQMQMLGGKDDNSSRGASGDYNRGNHTPAPAQTSSASDYAAAKGSSAMSRPANGGGVANMDDDIPFAKVDGRLY